MLVTSIGTFNPGYLRKESLRWYSGDIKIICADINHAVASKVSVSVNAPIGAFLV